MKIIEVIAISAMTSLIVSVLCCKISAAYTFKVIDGYVKDMIEIAKKSIRDTYFDK